MSLEIVTLFPAFNCITLDADAVVVVVFEVEAKSAALFINIFTCISLARISKK